MGRDPKQLAEIAKHVTSQMFQLSSRRVSLTDSRSGQMLSLSWSTPSQHLSVCFICDSQSPRGGHTHILGPMKSLAPKILKRRGLTQSILPGRGSDLTGDMTMRSSRHIQGPIVEFDPVIRSCQQIVRHLKYHTINPALSPISPDSYLSMKTVFPGGTEGQLGVTSVTHKPYSLIRLSSRTKMGASVISSG